MSSLKDRVIQDLNERRERVLSGKINSIPSPFKRFRCAFPGIEQGKYYLITGGTKSAKTQFSSFLFVYNSLLYAYKNPDKARVKIFYYNLEESKEDIMLRFMCYILYTQSGFDIKISPTQLKSVSINAVADKSVLNLLESDEYKDILAFFEEHIIFGDSANPTGIFLEVKKYLDEHGTVHKKKAMIKDEFGRPLEIEKFDYYESDDPDEYRILFIDHISLISTEKDYTLKKSMDKLSEYCVQLRNRYKITPVIIQQQSFDSESLGAFQAKRTKPTLATMSDSRYLSRDSNIALGIFSPFRMELTEYASYDISVLKDHARFVEILIDRSGSPGSVLPLYFDGAVNYFAELPNPRTQERELGILYDKLRLNQAITLVSICNKIKTFFKL